MQGLARAAEKPPAQEQQWKTTEKTIGRGIATAENPGGVLASDRGAGTIARPSGDLRKQNRPSPRGAGRGFP